MPAIPLIVGAAVSVGTAAVQANQQKKAAQAAETAAAQGTAAQNAALGNVKGVDIPALTEQARATDLAKYKSQFNDLNSVDPVTGEIRTAANAGLLGSVNDQNTSNSDRILQTLFDENINVDPNDKAFYDKLKAEASRQLDLGGNLSPEQQAEFVRAGLEQGAGSGYQAGSSALKQGVGKLLASEQEALGNSRRSMAQQLFGFATNLKSTRTGELSGLAGQSRDASNSAFSKLFGLANLADSRTPDIGLSGADTANLTVANNNLENEKALQAGGIAANSANTAAQLALERGKIASGLTGAVGSSVGTLSGSLLKLPKKSAVSPAAKSISSGILSSSTYGRV